MRAKTMTSHCSFLTGVFSSLRIAIGIGALAMVGCGGVPMGTLIEGVGGPFDSLPYGDDHLTVASKESVSAPSKYSDFYIQAMVNKAKVGDTVIATVSSTGAMETFTAPQAGDVGIYFRFRSPSGYWPTGPTVITVTSGSRKIGTVSFNIKN